MNHALTLRRPAPLRIGLFLILSAAFLLASAASIAPALVRGAASASHSGVCKCAHCPGGADCCCRLNGACPMP